MKDVDTAWPDAAAEPTTPTADHHPIAWSTSPNPAVTPPDPPAPPTTTATTTTAATTTTTTPATTTIASPAKDAAAASSAKPPLLQRARTLVCKLPDPTLLFLLQTSLLLLLHQVKPAVLRCWPARIATPLLLLPTVCACVLWRRTIVMPRAVARPIATRVAPVPRAARVVRRGEVLRTREAALRRAEEDLRLGQLKLEVLRRQIEQNLPPAVTIANMLASEASNA